MARHVHLWSSQRFCFTKEDQNCFLKLLSWKPLFRGSVAHLDLNTLYCWQSGLWWQSQDITELSAEPRVVLSSQPVTAVRTGGVLRGGEHLKDLIGGQGLDKGVSSGGVGVIVGLSKDWLVPSELGAQVGMSIPAIAISPGSSDQSLAAQRAIVGEFGVVSIDANRGRRRCTNTHREGLGRHLE